MKKILLWVLCLLLGFGAVIGIAYAIKNGNVDSNTSGTVSTETKQDPSLTQIAELNEKIDKYAKEISTLKTYITELEQSTEDNQVIIDGLEEVVQNKTNELETLRNELLDLQARYDELQADYNELEEAYSSSQLDTATLLGLYDGSITELVIPEGIESIRPYAFYKLSSLTSVKCPSTLKAINQGAFNGCSSLKNILFNEGLERIESQAFAYCPGINEIILPSTINYVDSQSFVFSSGITKFHALNNNLSTFSVSLTQSSNMKDFKFSSNYTDSSVSFGASVVCNSGGNINISCAGSLAFNDWGAMSLTDSNVAINAGNIIYGLRIGNSKNTNYVLNAKTFDFSGLSSIEQSSPSNTFNKLTVNCCSLVGATYRSYYVMSNLDMVLNITADDDFDLTDNIFYNSFYSNIYADYYLTINSLGDGQLVLDSTTGYGLEFLTKVALSGNIKIGDFAIPSGNSLELMCLHIDGNVEISRTQEIEYSNLSHLCLHHDTVQESAIYLMNDSTTNLTVNSSIFNDYVNHELFAYLNETETSSTMSVPYLFNDCSTYPQCCPFGQAA